MSQMTWRSMISDGLAMRHGKDLTWSQVVMAANTPMLLKAGLVEGNTDAGVLASGQVAGIIDDLPSCAELIDSIVAEAVAAPAVGGRRSSATERFGRCASGYSEAWPDLTEWFLTRRRAR